MKRLLNRTLDLKPEILSHPNIPIPLHGINPRNIKGKEWWDATRHEAMKRTKQHCVACGTHALNAKKFRYLECHEFFNIDYQTGRCEVESIEPLCHYCHNFIHSGRLSMIMGKEKPKREIISILEHGFNILDENDLKCFPFTLEFAESLGANTYDVEAYELNINPKLKKEDFVLIFEGEEYNSQYFDR